MADQERALKAIMFSDVKSFSAMMGEDEERTVRLVKEHRDVVRETLRRHHGEEHGTAGDSFFVLFGSAVEAVACAVEIQENFHRRNAAVPAQERIWIRIGIHVGDIVVDREDGHVYGEGINIAARTEPVAEPGGICITREVFQQVRSRLEVRAIRIGRREMKNIRDAPELYRLVVGPVAGGRKQPRSGGRGGAWLAAWIAGLAALLALGAAGVAFLPKGPGSGDPAGAVPVRPAEARTLIVLPFDNVANDPARSWLSAALAQGVSDRLRGERMWKVLDPPGQARSRALAADLSGDVLAREMGRQAGARWVVTGGFTAAAERVHVTVRALLVEDPSVTMLVSREGEADGVLALQENLARALAADLLPGLDRKEWYLAARAATRSEAAYGALARSREITDRDAGTTPQNWPVVRNLLEEAVRLDPDFIVARNALALNLFYLGISSLDVPLLRESLVHADAAVRVDPGGTFSPDTHHYGVYARRCGVYLALGSYSRARVDCDKALALDVDTYYTPGLYEALGEADQEEQRLEDLARREAGAYWPQYFLGSFLLRQGRPVDAQPHLAEAIRLQDATLAAGPDAYTRKAGWMDPIGAHGLEGGRLLAAGDLDGARQAFRKEVDGLQGRTHAYKSAWSAICHGNLALIEQLRGDREAQAATGAALSEDVAVGGAFMLAALARELAGGIPALNWPLARAVRPASADSEAQLERALSLAGKAVERTERKNPFFLELLAEVHEKRGERDLALAVNAEGKALLPECEAFDLRVKRLSSGDAKSPP